MEDVREAALLLSGDESWAEAFAAEARALLEGHGLDEKMPSQAITQVHRLLKQRSGLWIPFQERRERTNKAGMALAEEVKAGLSKARSKKRFQDLVRWAITGNSLDFRTAGAGYRFDLGEMGAQLRRIWERGLAVDDSRKLWEALSSAQRILYVLDNVGEIAFDKLFIEQGLKPGKTVIAVIRGGAITSDAVLEDAMMVGLDKTVDGLISSGSDTLGILWEEASSELKEGFKKADLVIAKGQANYYLFSEPEYRREIPGKVACLFTTKCDLVAGQFGKKEKVSILKMV